MPERTSLTSAFSEYVTLGECLDMIEEVHSRLDVDRLANFIRSTCGNNKMGTGQLAEKIVEFLKTELQ